MAKSRNRVDLLGYLGGDAKIKDFPDGKGAWTERTDWHAVVIWGAAATNAVLRKGARVHLTGRRATLQDGGRLQCQRRHRGVVAGTGRGPGRGLARGGRRCGPGLKPPRLAGRVPPQARAEREGQR